MPVLVLFVFGIPSYAVYYEPEDLDRKKLTISVILLINNDVALVIDIYIHWQRTRTKAYDNMDI